MRTKLKAEIENLKAIIAVEAAAEGMDENVEDNEILFSSICMERDYMITSWSSC